MTFFDHDLYLFQTALDANSTAGSNQNLAFPSAETTWTCIRGSSREKKK